MAVFSRVGAFLKNAWNKEPVITVSAGIGILAVILPFISPYTKYSSMYNQVIPYNYPASSFIVGNADLRGTVFYNCMYLDCTACISGEKEKIKVPVRDDGNMPDIPSHPSDKVGPNLDWLKKL